MRLLVVDVYLLRRTSSIEGPGYVYVSGGTILGLGEGEPPEDFQEAELVLGGEGRVVVASASVLIPGLLETAVFERMEGYAELERSEQLAEKLSAKASYYSALMTLYELSMTGVGFVVTPTVRPREAVKAVEESGLRAILLIPVNCGPLSSHGRWARLLEEALSAPKPKNLEKWGLYVCRAEPNVEEAARREGLVVVTESSAGAGHLFASRLKSIVVLRRGERLVGLGGLEAFTNPWLLAVRAGVPVEEAFEAVTVKLKELTGKLEGLQPRATADFVVLDLSEPPGWAPDPSRVTLYHLAFSKIRVESLIVLGVPVVDGGMNVALGPEKAQKASNILKEVQRAVL